jgi:hypothetical protein
MSRFNEAIHAYVGKRCGNQAPTDRSHCKSGEGSSSLDSIKSFLADHCIKAPYSARRLPSIVQLMESAAGSAHMAEPQQGLVQSGDRLDAAGLTMQR